MGMVEMLREADTWGPKSWGRVVCKAVREEREAVKVKKTQPKSRRKTRWYSVPRNQRRRKFQEGRSS